MGLSLFRVALSVCPVYYCGVYNLTVNGNSGSSRIRRRRSHQSDNVDDDCDEEHRSRRSRSANVVSGKDSSSSLALWSLMDISTFQLEIMGFDSHRRPVSLEVF